MAYSQSSTLNIPFWTNLLAIMICGHKFIHCELSEQYPPSFATIIVTGIPPTLWSLGTGIPLKFSSVWAYRNWQWPLLRDTGIMMRRIRPVTS